MTDREDEEEDEELLVTLRFPVLSGDAERLDRFIVAKLEARDAAARPEDALLVSRALIQRWIEEGRVRDAGAQPDAKPLRKSSKLFQGLVIEVSVPKRPAPAGPLLPEALPVPIIMIDGDVIVVDKPAGLTVHPGAGQRSGTLANALLHASKGELSHLGGDDRPGIVHRLDKDTSGVIVCARTDRAHRFLSREFQERRTKKQYVAIVEGWPREDAGTIDAPIGRSLRDRKKMAIRKDEGRAAVTRYAVRERFERDERFALVDVFPETGRTHQIRVHMASLGCPVLADATYGRRSELTGTGGEVLLARQALHAARLGIAHPNGAMLSLEAALHPDMMRALTWLRSGRES